MLAAAMKPNPVIKINRTYAKLYGIHCRYMVVYGGRRSAKSYSVSQLFVRKALENPGRVILVLRKVAATLRLSVWPRVQHALREAGVYSHCDVNKSDRTIVLPNGSQFIFVGADDVEKLKSFEGATDVWFEEANEFEELDLDTIDAGLSAAVYPPCQIWLTFNPVPIIESAMPWLAARFVTKIPHELSEVKIDGDICILRTWYKDNAFCPDTIVRLFKGYEQANPQLYKLWVLGEFTYLEGVIFKNWQVVDAVPTEGSVKLLGYGLDFGYANDPAALTKIWARGLKSDKPEIWLQEVVYETELTNQRLSGRMREAGVDRYDEIVADSAEPKSIQELRDMGWNVFAAVKGPDSVRNGIIQMQAMQIYIIKGSTNIVKEFSTYSWRKDSQGKVTPVPQDMFNHAIDGVRYRVTKPEQARVTLVM